MSKHTIESVGMVTDPGKTIRNLNLNKVSDYAKAQNITTEAAIKDLENSGYDLSTFKAVTPTTQKVDSLLDRIKSANLVTPITPLGLQPFGGAEFQDQVYDPKLGRLVGKDRPEGVIGAGAKFIDFMSGGLTDYDKSGGNLFGLGNQSLRGFGKQPTDYELPTSVKKSLETTLDPEKGSTNPYGDLDKLLDYQLKYKKAADTMDRKGRAVDSAMEFANLRTQMPFYMNQLKDLTTFKQRQLLDAEKIKQGLPNAQQARLLAADQGFASQAGAIAGQQDAATRFAALGANRSFGQLS